MSIRSTLFPPSIIASNLDRALIHQICDMCRLPLQHVHASALRLQTGCWCGAAAEACSGLSELAVQLQGRKQESTDKVDHTGSSPAMTGEQPHLS